MRSGDSHLRADLLLLLVTLLAAAGWIFSKEALAGLPPLLFIGVRFLLAGMLLAVFGWRQLVLLPGRGWLRSLLVGALFAVAMGFWIMGLASAKHLGEGAFISSLGIVLVPVLARFLFGDTPPRSTWVAIPMALLGFACLSLEHGFRVEPGQWWFFAAALAFALVFVTNSHVVRQVPVLALGTVQLTMVAVLILPLSWAFEAWPDRVATPVLGWALASALLGTTARFIVQLHAQGMTTPSHAAVILMLEPMWTAIVAAWWFGESMSMLQFLGCGLIFLALVVSRWSWIRGLFAS
ncbi:MAG TPA: DMT family transporter [Rhodocyclaceae bacterium]|nr:DMT family transporter [Rhodocyclaceae bacterium]